MSSTHKLTDQQKIDLVNDYTSDEFITLEKLSKKYGVNPTSVGRILKRRNIKIRSSPGNSEQQRKYSYNQDYFDVIDTEDKAYFLGLLYADGYVHKKNGTVSLSLKEDDVSILEKFAKCTLSLRPLVKIDSYFKRGLGKIQYKLLFQGRKFTDSLEILGCYQNKSLTLKFPTKEQVPTHLIRHFVRGYWDGDGCHGYTLKKYFNMYASLVSSIGFCLELEKLIKNKFQLGTNKYIIGKNKQSIRLILAYRNSIVDFLSWMYDDSNFYIQRKYDKYLEIKKLNSIKPQRKRNESILATLQQNSIS